MKRINLTRVKNHKNQTSHLTVLNFRLSLLLKIKIFLFYFQIKYVDILEADLVIVSVQFLLNNKAFTEKPKGIEGHIDFMRLMTKPGI